MTARRPGRAARPAPGHARGGRATPRAKAAATRAPARPRPSSPRRPTRWRGCWSTCRWPTSTARSTTSCRHRWPRPRSPGCRVKVRFAGQDVDGFVVERAATSDHGGRLTPLRRVVSAEPVLTPAVAELTASLADRYAGTRSDVLRLAVPPRHATAEKQHAPPRPPRSSTPTPAARPGPGTSRLPPSSTTWPPAAPRARCGPPPRRPTGRCWSPTPAPRRTPPGAARWSASPTAATSTGSTPRWSRCWARATTSR